MIDEPRACEFDEHGDPIFPGRHGDYMFDWSTCLEPDGNTIAIVDGDGRTIARVLDHGDADEQEHIARVMLHSPAMVRAFAGQNQEKIIQREEPRIGYALDFLGKCWRPPATKPKRPTLRLVHSRT